MSFFLSLVQIVRFDAEIVAHLAQQASAEFLLGIPQSRIPGPEK
jgi:hypothetical protein